MLKSMIQSLHSTFGVGFFESLKSLSLSAGIFLVLVSCGPSGDNSKAAATHVPNEPKDIHAASDGALSLQASAGRGVGPRIEYMPEWAAFGWFTSDDLVEWDVVVSAPGNYDVYLNWSVSDEEAGKPFAFEIADQRIEGVVEKSGSWETFKTMKIGEARLNEGRFKASFKPTSVFDKEGALLDLREVRLVPKANLP